MIKKVILDVDTGSDDAVAICAAALSPAVDLAAVCTVWGNQPIENTTDNTLRLISALGIDVPVYRGCSTAMTKYLCDDHVELNAARIRPKPIKDGREVMFHTPHLPIEPTDRRAEDMPAACFYVDYLRRASEKVTLVAVGPLTNVGLALRIAPDIIEHIEEIVIMGGGYHMTNADPWSEGNIYHDPEAAQIIADSGARVVWVPLDATHRAVITDEDCKRFREIGSFSAIFCAGQCEQRIFMHDSGQPLDIPHSAAVHDALCVAYVIDPSVLTDLRHCHIEIGLTGYGEGQTIVDRRAYPLERNGWFAFDADRFKFVDILCDCFKRDKSTARVLDE